MAYNTYGTGGLTKEGQLVTFEKRLLSRFRADTVFNRWGIQRSIPANGGKSISFRRLEAILGASWANVNASGGAYASGPAALTEGTSGAAVDATWTEVIATVSQYGQYLQLTDMAEAQSIDVLLPEYTENFAEAMTEGLDLVTRDILVAGTNLQYASTAGSRGGVGSGMNLNLAELRKGKRILMRANARPVRSEGKFVCVTHPDSLYDLEGDSNITNIWQYAKHQKVA